MSSHRTSMNPQLPPEIHRLAELGKTSGGFLHDIVNHVSAVTLSMDYLEQRVARDSELLREYATQTARMRKSIEEFAHGVRTYMKHGLVYCFFNPHKEIEYMLDLFRYRADAHRISLIHEGETRIRLYGNRLKFTQALSNLISNAIDACTESEHDDRHVTVRCKNVNSRVEIQVEDNGPGIPEVVQGRLFTPFVSTKKARGTGLGLVSTQKIVEEDFGGKIEVYTSPGVGTRFTLSIPARVNTTETTEQKTSSK